MNKKLLALFIVLVCAFSISAVSAEDGGSFTNLNSTISEAENTVDLDVDYVRESTDLNSAIDITKNIVINGNGKTIDGNNKGPIFKVGTGVTVTINDLTFINGNGDYGGAISNYGTLILNNCKFENNTATYRGGAVYSEGVLIVSDSIFDNNNITTRNVNNDYGGAAIANMGGVLTMKNTKVLNHIGDYVERDSTAAYKGDLIVGAVLTTGTTIIENSRFENNKGCYGGAITSFAPNYDTTKPIDVTITGTVFLNNTAYNGGAIDAMITNLNVMGCYFVDNVATGVGDTSINSGGGAIAAHYKNTTARLMGDLFYNNVAKGSGGALILQAGDKIVSNCVFVNNTADVQGGGAALLKPLPNGPNSNVTFDGCTFIDNEAPKFSDIAVEGGEKLILKNNLANDKGIEVDGAEMDNVTYITETKVNDEVSIVDGKIFITGTVSPTANGNVTIILTNKADSSVINKKGKVEDGKFSVDVGEIAEGDYEVKAEFEQNERYFNSKDSTNITINKIPVNLKADDVVKYYKNGTQLSVSLTDDEGNVLANQEITVTIDGQEFTVSTDSNGIATIDLDMVPGDYVAEIAYAGKEAYNAAETSVNVQILPTIVAPDIDMFYKDGTKYEVTLLDEQGNPIANKIVTVTINSPRFKNPVSYDRTTDSNGVASLPINLSPGEYTITAKYGDDSVESTVKIDPMTYKLSSNDIDMFYKDGTKYEVTLVDAKGNPAAGETVSLILNGKSFKNLKYDRVTDSNGVASLPINLAIGQYTITAKYGSEEVTTTVNVLQKQCNLVGNDLVKYFKNGTQYTVKLLDEDGNPAVGKTVSVTLVGQNMKSVTYNIRTDSNGIATLPINLVAGQYTITAKYESVSVTNKITVLPVLTTENLVVSVGQSADFIAKVVDEQGNPVSGVKVAFTIKFPSKSVTYYKITDSNGVAKLPIKLAQGTYTVNLSLDNGAKATGIVSVIKQ
ncbi:MAG: hypothetical protein Q4P18_00155 [Methanobrevibacter sp.]|uniref:hypothetical protein n=1 Tax=Methanobrevibacter sp. TaxID=66852 RepID=UPI0026E033F8|nr:hypothetical protein [Methanobrevibacter sp.]MDO5847935.1 hypothetical protein [Methanobrevibacter sp.]